jgi:hypothetical protein
MRKIFWKFEKENLMKYRRRGKNGPAVSAKDLGRTSMSEFYGSRDDTDPSRRFTVPWNCAL